MATKVTNTVAGAMLAAMTALANGGTLKIYTGTAPANTETAPTGTLLATLTLSATAFGAPSAVSGTNAVATANAITAGSAVASGTAGYFRVLSAGGTALWQGDISTSGAALNLGTTTITSGGSVAISSLTVTTPLT